ncbi:MAG: quinoprotein relay system zinc metallohydrolase 2 [Nitrosomonadales bacterium]|nr:quinoprotein relay system zinc metallohydrolase 2 [Nitrosomonadales bacterium]
MSPCINKCLLLLALLHGGAVLAAPFAVEQAAPGVYVHRGEHRDINAGYGGDICNIGFIIGSKGVAVIDSGGSPKIGAQLREAIRKVTDLPILFVINTHVHPDHVFGNAAFKKDNPTFVGHENLAAGMEQRKEVYLRNQAEWVGADAAGSELIPPALQIGGAQSIDLGGRTLLLTAYAPAHSHSDLTVFDTATATLWTGDLLFVERTPSMDGNLQGWLQAIAQLRAIPAERAIPGHGPVVQEWHGALDNVQRYLTTLLEDVRAAIRQGLGLQQTIESAARSEQGKWVLFDTINRRNVSFMYLVLEWE